MNNLYLSKALGKVKNPNILVNMVSQRVRQLGHGHKALVAADINMSYMDVALKEIADGKLEYEMMDPILLAESQKPKPKKKK